MAFFGRRTVTSITAPLKRIVADLHAHADERLNDAARHRDNADASHRQAEAAHQDHEEARRVATQIGALLA